MARRRRERSASLTPYAAESQQSDSSCTGPSNTQGSPQHSSSFSMHEAGTTTTTTSTTGGRRGVGKAKRRKRERDASHSSSVHEATRPSDDDDIFASHKRLFGTDHSPASPSTVFRPQDCDSSSTLQSSFPKTSARRPHLSSAFNPHGMASIQYRQERDAFAAATQLHNVKFHGLAIQVVPQSSF